MKKILLILLLSTSLFAQKKPLDYVNPLIGSAPSTTPSAKKHSEAGSELKGQVVPMIGVPQGLTTWTPQTRATEQKCIPPYYYNDGKIQGFRASHWMNGSCVQDYGTMTLMPQVGKVEINPEKRAEAYSRKTEIVRPDLYQVDLQNSGINVAMTALCRSGFFKIKYPNQQENYLIIEPNSDEGVGFVQIFPERKEIVGYNPVHRIYQGWGQPAGFSGYFVLQFDSDISDFGTWLKNEITPKQTIAQGKAVGENVGAYVRFASKVVNVRIGTSFTSIEGARKNLKAEISHWNFDLVKQSAANQWNMALGKIQVKGSDNDKTLFYSALYHAKLTPRVFSDFDGKYPQFAGGKTIETAKGFTYYEDYNLWDTYRAVHPLHTILEPKRTADMMQSLIVKAEQGGWLPIFPCWNQYTAAMIGDHAISVIGDAYIKGIKGFDIEKGYRYMRKNAFEPNPDAKSYEQGQGRRALSSYLKYHYIPLEDSVWQAFHKREQVSRTLEYAYDDFVLGKVAEKLGKKADAEILAQRAQNYKNVIDPQTGWARGRYADGSWIAQFDPFAQRSSFITEGSPAQYTFYVPQDIQGLIAQVGGKERFIQKLDTLFEQGYYWHGNEPNNQIAYLYPYAGQAEKTQKWLRKIIREEYDTSAGGMSGNEDGGQMSSWLVFSMMGFYPVCPGNPSYTLGSPMFDEVKIQTPSGKYFTIKTYNQSDNHPMIDKMKLNGKPFSAIEITHQELLKGGLLEVWMK